MKQCLPPVRLSQGRDGCGETKKKTKTKRKKKNGGLRRTEGFVERRASKNGGLRNLVPKEVCCVGQHATKGVQRPTKSAALVSTVLKRVQRPTKRLLRLSACCTRGPATHQEVLRWSANKGPAIHKRRCVGQQTRVQRPTKGAALVSTP